MPMYFTLKKCSVFISLECTDLLAAVPKLLLSVEQTEFLQYVYPHKNKEQSQVNCQVSLNTKREGTATA